MELVKTILIKLNFNKVCQWYTVKPMQIYWPHSSRLLPGFSPSWKAQTSFHIYLSGTVPPLNFPAPSTLGSQLCRSLEGFPSPWMKQRSKSPKSHQSAWLLLVWKRDCEPRQLLARSLAALAELAELPSAFQPRSAPGQWVVRHPCHTAEELRMDFHAHFPQFGADPPEGQLWAKSRRDGPSGCEALCACFAVEPTSPNTSSAKGTYGDAEQQKIWKALEALIAACWKGWNQAKTTAAAGGCWGFGERVQLQEKCVIISALLKEAQMNKYWFMGNLEIQTVPSSRKSRTVAGSSSWSCPGAWESCRAALLPIWHSRGDVREGSQPYHVFPALGVAAGQAGEEWGHHAQNSQGQLTERDFCLT